LIRTPPPEEVLGTSCQVLGLGGWTLYLFVLAAAGWLNGGWIAAGAVTGAVAGGWTLFRRWRERRRYRLRFSGSALAVAGVATAILLPLFLLAATPVVSWDAAAYHLTLPRLYLEAGGFRPVPMNVYSNWPLGTELLYAAALAVGDRVVAKLLHFGFGLLVLGGIFLGARSLLRGEPRRAKLAGAVGAACFLANGVVAFEMRVAYVDLAHAFFFLAGFLFVDRALEAKDPEEEGRWLLLAGVCCGLIAGIKLNGIVAVALLGALYLPRLASAARRGGLGRLAGSLAGRLAVPAVALWLPWLVKSAWLTGNPVYPFLHRTFGGADWSPELTEKLLAWQRSIGMGREPVDYLLLPLRVILAGGRGYDRFDGELGAFWIVLVPVALLVAVGRSSESRRAVRRCLGVAALFFVFWAATSQQMRLLVPALPLLALAAGVAVAELVARLPQPEWRAALRSGAAVSAAALVFGVLAPTLAAGYRTLPRYLAAEGDLLATAVHPVFVFVDQELPPDARLLFLNTNQGYFCRRDYLADSFFEASQIAHWLAPAGDDVDHLRDRLAGRGVTHLLVDRRNLGIPYPPSLPRLLADPSLARPLYRSPDGRFDVVELR